jgi:ribosomal-protein-alanine N-acetyltransferase
MRVVLRTERLVLALPHPDAAALVIRHFVENEEHRGRWDPPRPRNFLTERYWREALSKARGEYARRVSMKLILFHGGAVIGTCNFTQFTTRQYRLGYGLDRRFEGHGYMTEALRAAIPHVFERFAIERIVASYRPENVRSASVLERLGFVLKGSEKQVQGSEVIPHVKVELARPE